ncbi:MerR family transcriptional regulator [Neobacillus notoginsengisoli]|uniref:MerR family transcriptional regulator n=1 Tax=Neobacillus notoginsengisoli TaxID=1578198 RepID=A0A417YWW6_9BACI|nr:MerR family transcriptional regulator [Neobacillus notoginsengisoli]RHW42046.1 MerR family transcriptional regulator [Neobacillus notoginsengisoli]
MKDGQVIKAYTIREVSKRLNVPPGTLRQWEHDLGGLVVIPRTRQGSRFYTETEISLLLKIKQMREKNLGKEMIRKLIEEHFKQSSEAASETIEPTRKVINTASPVPANNEPVLQSAEPPVQQAFDMEAFYGALEAYKKDFLADVKEEIRGTVRKELLEDLKKEVSKGSFHTVKSLSDSIYKSSERTLAEVEELASQVSRASEQASETARFLSNSISHVSKASSEQFATITKRMAQASERSSKEMKALVKSMSDTNIVTENVVESFNETLIKDREFYMDTLHMERMIHSQEMDRREELLQEIISSFKDAAAAQEKKWWKLWR